MGRFLVTVIDGFGIGAMKDINEESIGANTCLSILTEYPKVQLPTLMQLGLGNIFSIEQANLYKNDKAIWGTCSLQHAGADTFMGHQEIMGSLPHKPVKQRLEESLYQVKEALEEHHYHVRIRTVKDFHYLIVNEAVVVSDNIDSDLGQAINCIGAFDLISFDELLQIANVVRKNVTCNRVIAFGGTHVTLDDLIQAEEIKEEHYFGNVAVKTRVYEHDYRVRHLGYGVDKNVQVPTILGEQHIPVVLIGKVADIVQNPYGKSINGVDTDEVLDRMECELKQLKHGFICTNVQESDLAGHSMNTQWYKNILVKCDTHFARMLPLLQDDDIFLVCADHGNDPTIGHNHHTREYVPLLVYKKGKEQIALGKRTTLSDIGATVCEYFQCKPCENGTSFLSLIK